MLRDAMGEGVIDHYVRCAEWEQEDFDRKVTDYERNRCFAQGLASHCWLRTGDWPTCP
jgi:glutamine synthetase